MSDRRILLADDSPTIQKVVNLTFADEGIDVVCASDGDSAFQMVSEFTPDLVLADVNMPGKTGYELCQALRGREETRQTPVILLVGSFEPFDEDKALEVGANDYLTKPFQSIRQLVSTVSELLKSPSEQPVEKVQVEEPSVESEVASLQSTDPTQPERDDIEDLYRDSFVDTAELPHEQKGLDRWDLGDPGLDDELIETELADGIQPEESIHAPTNESETSEILSPIDTGDVKFSEPEYQAADTINFEDTIRDEVPGSMEIPSESDVSPETQIETEFDRAEVPSGDEFASTEENLTDVQSNVETPDPSEFVAELTPWAGSPDMFEEVTQEFELADTENEDVSKVDVPVVGESGSISTTEEFPDLNVLDLPEEGSDRPRNGQVNNDFISDQGFSPEMLDLLADRVAERVAESLARHLARQVVPDVIRVMEEERKTES